MNHERNPSIEQSKNICRGGVFDVHSGKRKEEPLPPKSSHHLFTENGEIRLLHDSEITRWVDSNACGGIAFKEITESEVIIFFSNPNSLEPKSPNSIESANNIDRPSLMFTTVPWNADEHLGPYFINHAIL